MTTTPPKPTAHLVHGYLGVGKTTFARRLSTDNGAICLSADEWYLRLYTDGSPTEHLDDVLYGRLTHHLDDLWPQLLSRGLDVILDFGYWSRADRDHARARAVAAHAKVILYSVVCDETTARKRLTTRPTQPGGSFVISEAAYDQLRTKFEPLGPDEPHTLIDTSHV